MKRGTRDPAGVQVEWRLSNDTLYTCKDSPNLTADWTYLTSQYHYLLHVI